MPGTREMMVLTAALLSTACTTVAYPGPRRPAEEVSTLHQTDTEIEKIDGRTVSHNRNIEILPGWHAVSVSLDALRTGVAEIIYYSSNDSTVCFKAYAGHRYNVRPAQMAVYMSSHWRPEIYDLASSAPVQRPCIQMAIPPNQRPRPDITTTPSSPDTAGEPPGAAPTSEGATPAPSVPAPRGPAVHQRRDDE